ncbi:MAG: hypothetical protein AAF752_03805, partial [Bacteroidota bacterium]
MKKPRSFDKKLVAYSAAAGVALAAAGDAEAQRSLKPDRDVQVTPVTAGPAQQRGPIVYRDINPDIVVDGNAVSLDFDGDGRPDVRFSQIPYIPYNTTQGQLAFASVLSSPSTRALVAPTTDPNYPLALDSGSPVSASQPFGRGGSFTTNGTTYRYFTLGYRLFGATTGGNWLNTTDKFLGVRFVADENGTPTTHYAWVRLDVADTAGSITIKDFAYAATPGDAINTLTILPVELTSFDVSIVAGTPRLAWTTATEDDNAGFEVQARRLDQPDFRTLGFVNGAGTTSEAQAYSFDATDLTPGRYA